MKKLTRILVLIAIIAAVSCSGTDNYPPVENALDAGRQFIDAVLKGNFRRAGMLIVEDTSNRKLLTEQMAPNYNKKSSNEKEELRHASINVSQSEEVMKDSIIIIHFVNSYEKEPHVLKVVRQDGTWKVDLKYTFSGNL